MDFERKSAIWALAPRPVAEPSRATAAKEASGDTTGAPSLPLEPTPSYLLALAFKLSPELAEKVRQCKIILDEAGVALLIDMDFNFTVCVDDSTSGHSAFRDTVQEALGKSAFGVRVPRRKQPAYWSPYLTNPFKRRGHHGEISWYEFQRAVNPDDAVLKPKAARFIETDGKHLRAEFEVMLAQGRAIFASYYVLMLAFGTAKCAWRTFGKDIGHAIAELRQNGLIRPDEKVSAYTVVENSLRIGAGKSVRTLTPQEFVREVATTPGQRFVTVQEDVGHWKAKGKKAEFGKRVCGTNAEENDGSSAAFQVGFDDLDCMVATGRRARVHRVSTYATLTEPEYFVEFVVADILDAKARGELQPKAVA